MIVFFLIAIACTPLTPAANEMENSTLPGATVPDADISETATPEMVGEEMTLYLAPELVDCVGVAPMQCLQVKTSEAGDYELFYEGIDGFVYVPGYEYELRVQRMERVNPPADASQYVYSLIEVVSQVPAYEGEALTLEGPEWGLVAFGAEDMVNYQPDLGLITANFGDGAVTGNAGCNRYNGSYEIDGDMMVGAITISEVASTRMLCPDEVMAAENAYFSALESTAAYAIEGNLLTITYAAGQLTFMAATEMAEETAAGDVEAGMATTTVCRFAGTGATVAIEDKRANFTCGAPDVVLLGEMAPGFDGWFIEKATLTRSDSEFTVAESTQAMVLQIELEDGTRCDWAGSGATLAFDEKRVNFSCDKQDVVLLGEVEQAAEGWLIEKATLAHDDTDGFSIESSESALIAALLVE